jgi:hypothetical protein
MQVSMTSSLIVLKCGILDLPYFNQAQSLVTEVKFDCDYEV